MKLFSVLTRKAIADVTRRKGRTMLMILGIFIGVLGLTAVNGASDRPCDGHGRHLWAGPMVWRKLLRQGKSPSTGFIHDKTSFSPYISTETHLTHQLFTNVRNVQSAARARQNQPVIGSCA